MNCSEYNDLESLNSEIDNVETYVSKLKIKRDILLRKRNFKYYVFINENLPSEITEICLTYLPYNWCKTHELFIGNTCIKCYKTAQLHYKLNESVFTRFINSNLYVKIPLENFKDFDDKIMISYWNCGLSNGNNYMICDNDQMIIRFNIKEGIEFIIPANTTIVKRCYDCILYVNKKELIQINNFKYDHDGYICL